MHTIPKGRQRTHSVHTVWMKDLWASPEPIVDVGTALLILLPGFISRLEQALPAPHSAKSLTLRLPVPTCDPYPAGAFFLRFFVPSSLVPFS